MDKKIPEQEVTCLLGQTEWEESTGESIAHGVYPACGDDLCFDPEVLDKYPGRVMDYGCPACEWHDYSWGVSGSTDRHGLV